VKTSQRALERRQLRLKTLAVAMLLANPARYAMADARDEAADIGEAVEFDASMLGASHQGIDLTRFAHGTPIDPGLHDLQLFVNERAMSRRDVRFANVEGRAQAQPCIDDALLDSVGVLPDARVRSADADIDACRLLDAILPGATAHYDAADFALHLSIPQAFLAHAARDEIDPSLWDPGVTAARLNYSFNTYQTQVEQGAEYRSASLQLEAGANLGAWRLRHRSMQTWSQGAGRQGNVLSAYAQTDLPGHRAQLTVGDFQTSGLLFDSIGLRGLRMESDERMSPDSQRGYAPVVQGIAYSNAVVTIRQNGNVIHEVNVPAGPFVIRDLYPTGYGGALDVTVTEADGRQEVFVVPYASLVQLVRPGTSRFSLAMGEWQGFGTQDRPFVLQATGQRGVSNLLTMYSGLQATEDYASLLAGTALNTRLGAFALDITNAWSQPDKQTLSGQSARLSYSQYLPSTRTSLMVAAHRHSTRDFYSLADQISASDTPASQRYRPRARNQLELQVSQPLWNGTLYASASSRDFWDRLVPERYAQLSYGWNIGRVGLSLAGRWRDNEVGHAGEAYFSLSLPLGGAGRSSHRISSNGGYARDRKAFGTVSLTGNGGPDGRASYGLTTSYAGSGSAVRTGASLGYEGSRGRAGFMASLGGGERQWSASADGGLLWHAGGLTAGPSMGDTIGLVHAPGATGAQIAGGTGARVDRNGYAIVSSLSPYRRNVIEVDPRGLPTDLQFDATALETIPSAGAVVAMPFQTRRERSWILNAQRHDGEAVPFGAQVHDASDSVLGTVGQGGLAFLSGEPARGPMRVRWGDAVHQQCEIADGLHPPAETRDAVLAQVDATCVSVPREQ
jgi:outer membrane usher protein